MTLSLGPEPKITENERAWQTAYAEWWGALKANDRAKAQELCNAAHSAWLRLNEPERDGAWERYLAR